MKQQSHRRQQVAKAQRQYRQRSKIAGQHRIDVVLDNETYNLLSSLCAAQGLTQTMCITKGLQALGKPVQQLGRTMSQDRADLSPTLCDMSRDELLNLILKQRYWLDRLQKVNNTLMNDGSAKLP